MIETLFIAVFVGSYMFYGEILVNYVQNYFGLEPSSYLYAAVGVCVIIVATILGKFVSRGLK